MPRKKRQMLNDYQKGEDAALRLQDTVIFFKGIPYYVKTEGMTLHLFGLRHEMPRLGSCPANSPDVEVRSPPLGFVNTKDTVYWVFRPPYRKQKQGLCTENCCFSQLEEKDFDRISTRQMCTQSFENMLLDKYPSYEDAMESGVHRAFHKQFAIMKNEGQPCKLLHLNRCVALYDKAKEAWSIKPEEYNSILQMSLEELGVPLAE